MTDEDKQQLKTEIDYIFNTGANQIRIYDMVINFFNKRNESRILEKENSFTTISNAISSIERILEKEKNHLAFLISNNASHIMISVCEDQISYYEYKLKEYKNYLIKTNDK